MAFWVYEVSVSKPAHKLYLGPLNTLGDYLLKYRTESRLSQQEVGEFLGVCNQTISNWENNINEPYFICGPKIIQLIGINQIETLFPPDSFGNKIKVFRLIRGITQIELGNELSISNGVISSWENNQKKPGKESLKRFMVMYQVAKMEYDSNVVQSQDQKSKLT